MISAAHTQRRVLRNPYCKVIQRGIKRSSWILRNSCHRNQHLHICSHYELLGSREFRLLRGHRIWDGSLHGELRAFSVGSLDTPGFNTISYAWGQPTFDNSIQVGDSQVPVPDSLYPFLVKALDDYPEAWWWVDSLCINQMDDAEKSQQVPLMREIFVSAGSTFVWLGERSEDSDKAIAFLHYLGDEFWYESEWYRMDPSSTWIKKVGSRDGEYRHEWDALERLFQRPWWRRVWTVQEHIVSKDVVFRCGNSAITGEIFRKAVLAIWQCHRASGSFRYDAQWNRNRILEYHGRQFPGRPSLVALLAYLGDHFSTDPRDRVYSLSGLVRDPSLIGSPNYDNTVESFYANIVEAFIEKYQSLDVICFATNFRQNSLDSASNDVLPSWVPDWSVPTVPLVVPLMVSQGARRHVGNMRPSWARAHSACYTASLNRSPGLSFSPDKRELRCQGIMLDVIDGLSSASNWITARTSEEHHNEILVPATSPHHGTFSAISSGEAQTCAAVIKSIMRCLVLDRKDHYLNHFAPEQRFMNEMRSLVDIARSSWDETYTPFTVWYHTNRSFAIDGIDLATLFEKVFSARIPEAHELPESQERVDRLERQSFASRFHDTTVKMARRLIVTGNGLLAMAPRRSRKGDVVAILYGCSVPVVLRKNATTDQYRFIGECYVDGYMYGEALDEGSNFKERTFNLV